MKDTPALDNTSRGFPWLHFVPQQYTYVVEKYGKFKEARGAGMLCLIPFVEKIAYVRSAQEDTLHIDPQHAITKDNVQVTLDGMVYYQVIDTYDSCYNITNPARAISNLAQAAMRKQVGSMTLDELFHNRPVLNECVTAGLKEIRERWGIVINRYEIQDIQMGPETSKAMEKQSAAERERRARVIASEGYKIETENKAEGDRISWVKKAEGEAQRVRLAAEAEKDKAVLDAQADAQRVVLAAEADAQRVRLAAEADAQRVRVAIQAESESIGVLAAQVESEGGQKGVQAMLASRYTTQMLGVLSNAKTVVVPQDATSIPAHLERAMAVWQ